ncbi:MAG: RluA family pseudouridine synthase [Hyphomonadaceae bacterium]|nr:RluA family pseudouridine synthase [Hyphomonadaceae bacterium]
MTFPTALVYTAHMTELSALAGEDDKGTRLDRFLSERLDSLSRSRAKALIKDGRVYQGTGPARQVQNDPRAPVIPGTVYALDMPDPVPAITEPEDIPLDILFEDEHLILINKAAGMAVHPAPGSWQGTLVNALLHHCKGQLPGIGGVERPGIVHRIDKDTTGVLVVAKTEPAHKGLSDLFAAHDIDRTYLALTRGSPRPSVGTVKTDIARSPRDRKKMAVVADGDGRQAVTHYKALETYGEISKTEARPAAALIECKLETGRTHQIRVHMAHLGCSLIGDPVYGRHRGIKASGRGPAFDEATSLARKLTRQALHAASLGFEHPISKQPIFVETPLPDDMARVRAALQRL